MDIFLACAFNKIAHIYILLACAADANLISDGMGTIERKDNV